jgi:thiosulfate dehydrogenase (quinone) large subunit
MKANHSAAIEALPLRLFLGIIFFFAGLDKVTDPTFFDPKNANYIGAQLHGFVTYNHSPLSFLLTSIAIPNAALFGALIAIGEMVCGLLALLGLFTRRAAALGLALSSTLWLTASWGQQPFYTSWDLPYMFGWLTLLLLGAGRYSLDEWRAANRAVRPDVAIADASRRRFLVTAGAMVGAVAALLIAGGEVLGGFASRGQGATTSTLNDKAAPTTPTQISGGSGNVNASPLAPTATPAASSPNIPPAQPTDTPPSAAAPTDTAAQAGPTDPTQPPAAAPANGTLIAHTSDVPAGGGLRFTDPVTGDDAYIIHLNDGRFVAFDAICTHAGCTVDYDSQNTIFYCPCHGAEFDPSNDGAVLRRPARSPLAKLNISVDQSSGNIYYLGS